MRSADEQRALVINFGSDSFEGTDLDRMLRATNVGHLFVSGQCIEHVVATTIKRAANMGYNAILIKDATSGFTDSNYNAMLDILPLIRKSSPPTSSRWKRPMALVRALRRLPVTGVI